MSVWRNSQTRLDTGSREAFRIFAPPPDLTLSAWADRYRKLSPEAAAEPGQWITARAEFQRGIMDAMNDPAVAQVVVMKSAQVGWTEILLNAIGYFIHQDPAPILCVQPTLEMGQAFSKDRFAPMLRDTVAIRDKVSSAKSKSGENTLLHKKFPGGHVTIAGANSAAGLASRPIRVALFDEVDRYPPSAGTEGDPVSLGRKRTRTFWNRVILMGSTPTVKGASRIENEYEKSDQRRFHVPCPDCGHMAPLDFEDFDWSGDEVTRVCRECGSLATESDKPEMVRKGGWVAGAEFSGIAGFHINEFYSPWSTWAEIFAEYERVKGNREQLKTWVNTTLGETWADDGEDIDPEGLAARAELYQAQVPAGALLLTAGVDVQQDRFEASVWGWNENGESWLVEHKIITADPSIADEWKWLDDWLMSARYKHQTGAEVGITAACVDSGYLSDQVYRYCAKRYARRVYAVKGYEGEGRPAVAAMAKPKTTGPRPTRMFAAGVDTIKAHLYAALSTEEPGAHYVHFPTGMEGEFYAQLTAERREIKYVRGFRRHVWVKKRRRNEALDCWVYAYAALQVLNPVWSRIEVKPPKQPEPEKPAPTPAKQLEQARLTKSRAIKRRKGGYVNRWR